MLLTSVYTQNDFFINPSNNKEYLNNIPYVTVLSVGPNTQDPPLKGVQFIWFTVSEHSVYRRLASRQKQHGRNARRSKQFMVARK